MCDVHSMRPSRARLKTRGVEREPGERAAWVIPQRASSSTNARSPRYVSVAVMRDLVLLHGFTQTGRSWAPLIAELQGRYRCFAPDLPGHGDAEARRPASFDAVAAYLGALKLDRFVLCGYSMG